MQVKHLAQWPSQTEHYEVSTINRAYMLSPVKYYSLIFKMDINIPIYEMEKWVFGVAS